MHEDNDIEIVDIGTESYDYCVSCGIDPLQPTQYRPGTEMKKKIIAARYEKGVYLHLPGDFHLENEHRVANTMIGLAVVDPENETLDDDDDFDLGGSE